MLRPLALTGFLITALGTSLAAQQARPAFEPWEAPSSSLVQAQFGSTSRSDTLVAPRRDYRYEGLLVVGGGLGYLVGRLSPKPVSRDSLWPSQPFLTPPSIPDSVRRRVGYQHWRGGGLGLAIGGAVGALTAAVLGTTRCDDCGRQPSGALAGGLVGAGAGGVLGFLVGLSSPTYRMIPTTNAEQ